MSENNLFIYFYVIVWTVKKSWHLRWTAAAEVFGGETLRVTDT